MKLLYTFSCALLLLGPACAAVVGPTPGTIVDGAQPATVMEVNPVGIGHVNLVPYFSTRSGFDTYVNVVNTDTRNGKAVKVRFRSAVNGEDVGNFTVLMGPGDVWAAALTRDSTTGYTRVAYGDKSCTLPASVAVTLGPSYVPVSGRQDVDVTRTQEGSAEIITMADIPRLETGGQVSALFNAITVSGSATAPGCSPSVLSTLAVDSIGYADARSKGLEVPTSGLMTEWTLINVPRAVSYTSRATAVEARVGAGGVPGYGNVVLFPQTQAQVADAARTVSYTTNPNIRNVPPQPAYGYIENQLPDLSTPYLPAGLAALPAGAAARRQAHAITKALATTSIGSQFITEPGILAKTDWVVTLPTRYLQVGYIPPSVMGAFGSPLVISFAMDDTGAPAGPGVTNYFEATPGNVKFDINIDPVCITGVDPYTAGIPSSAQPHTETTWRSREGAALTLSPETSNGNLLPFALCGHSMILRFAKPGDDPSIGVLGDARNRRQLISSATAGWGRIQTPGLAGVGLPIIGFAVSELFNSAVAPGFAGVFGLSYPLSTTKPAP